MKTNYRLLILILLCMNIGIGLMTKYFTPKSPAEFFLEKSKAVELAQKAHSIIGSQLLGVEYTFATTTIAPLSAKELSLHPDFTALAVEYLRKAGVKTGDRVAVNFSGSFPAINICVLAALQTLGAEPLIISSAGASTWGANREDLLWPDMEAKLISAGIWQWQSLAVSLGGINDNGGGLLPEGKEILRQAILRSHRTPLEPESLQQAIDMRLSLYRQHNSGQLPTVLINVGGNHVIFGKNGHKVPLKEGLSHGYDFTLNRHNGLAQAFIASNRPIIHFINIERLAAKHNIKRNIVGQSSVLYQQQVSNVQRLGLFIMVVANFIILYRCRPR